MKADIINKEWASRPDDQRFLSMTELHRFNEDKMRRSVEGAAPLGQLRLQAEDGEVVMQGANGKPLGMTNWAFGQLATRAHAPAGYLRTLPATLAVVPLQWSMEREGGNVNMLVRGSPTPGLNKVQAFTSGTYGRIYDADVTKAMLAHIDLNVWKVPHASYASANPKRATTLYASDRDMFVALVDDQHPIGKGKDVLFRGFIARNSEVGAYAYDFFMFLYRYICDNRLIWGMQEATQLKIRHTSGGPMRFLQEAKPVLREYLEQSAAPAMAAIQAAKNKEIAKEDVDVVEWLRKRGFTETAGTKAIDLAKMEDGLNPHSVWGVVQGLTSYAHEQKYGDERLDLERKAGKLLDLAA